MAFDAFDKLSLPEFIANEIEPAALWVFVHVPRAAGSSFAAELANFRPSHKHLHADIEEEQFPQTDNIDRAVEHFVLELRTREYKACSGHIRMAHVNRIKSVEPRARAVSLIRNPVDRVISNYRFGRSATHPSALEFVRKYPTIHSYVEAPENRNRMIGLLAPESGGDLTEKLTAIDRSLLFVGLLEMYPMTFNVMSRLLGQDSLPRIHKNATARAEANGLAVDAELKRRIARNNELDNALYEHVRQKLIAKRDEWRTMLVEKNTGSVAPAPKLDRALRKPKKRTESSATSAAAGHGNRAAEPLDRARLARLVHRVRWLEQERMRIRADNLRLAKISHQIFAPSISRSPDSTPFLDRVCTRRETVLRALKLTAGNAGEFAVYAKEVNNDPRRLAAYLQNLAVQSSPIASTEVRAVALAIRDLFDPVYYRSASGLTEEEAPNPLLHYIMTGCREGFSPNPLFDRECYLAQTGRLDEDPLLHFARIGAYSGLNPHPLFDCWFYARQCEAAGVQYGNPLSHYQTTGGLMRLDPSPIFDTAFYLSGLDHPDEIECPLEHYVLSRARAVADPHPLFSATRLRKTASSVRSEPALVSYLKSRDLQFQRDPHHLFSIRYLIEQGCLNRNDPRSPLEQYIASSADRDIDPHPCFSSAFYRYQMEVERGVVLTMPPAIHYITTGFRDKTLSPHPLFDPGIYLKANRLHPDGPELVRYLSRRDGDGLRCHELFDSRFYDRQRKDELTGGDKITALEHWICDPEKQLRTDSRLVGPLDPLPQEFLLHAVTVANEFEPAFYRRLYNEFAEFDDSAVRSHYENHGRAEGRHGSARSLLKNVMLRVADVPIGFFPAEYVALHPDLGTWRDQPMRSLVHFLENGRAENRQIGHWQLKIDDLVLNIPTKESPVLARRSSGVGRLGVMIHVYYPELWPELAGFARNLHAASTDVFINVSDNQWTPQLQRKLRELCPEAFAHLSPNRGRDIGGHLRMLDNVDIMAYDAFAFMHTKKSGHLSAEKSGGWRQGLIAAFAGNESIAAECLKLFRERPKTGMIGAEVCRTYTMNGNQTEVDRLMALFGVEQHNRRLDYVSGTMFMIRADVVARLHRELRDTSWEDPAGRDAAFFMDGQIEHAVERVIPAVARQMGYDVVYR